MTPEISPLRYPGGKGALAPFLGRLLEGLSPACTTFVEPFAGGAGAALHLLRGEFVDRVVLNDLDGGIAAFWRSVFGRNQELVERIRETPVTMESWHHEREVFLAGSAADDLDRGFATFFLNRTNRSGILAARPIGGLGQAGAWTLDVRFNKDDLVRRIETLGHYRNRVTICEEDGLDVIRRHLGANDFIYADPPYLVRGSGLYLNRLTWLDHQTLANVLTASSGRWMVTYDHDDRVAALYPAMRRAVFGIAHTASSPHVGLEYAVFSDAIHVASLEGLGRLGGAWVAA